MTFEDQVVALFAKANPVPSLDLLDVVEPLDMGHLADLPERSSAVTEASTTAISMPGQFGRNQRRANIRAADPTPVPKAAGLKVGNAWPRTASF